MSALPEVARLELICHWLRCKAVGCGVADVKWMTLRCSVGLE